MNRLLLNTESQEFINAHINSDITKLILKGTSFDDIETIELIEQIESKKKSQNKLPTWYHHDNIYYPSKLQIEQSSSEIAAEYKASLITGTNLIDLTGGFGVDSFYFSKRFESVTHCEINERLSSIVQHNFTQLNVENIETIFGDGIAHLKHSTRTYDWIYIDPSRRHESKGKVFFLADCLPNVLKELGFLFQHSNNIMIKTSPLLDISIGVGELHHVKKIHVVAINNEMKELLWILEKGFHSDITIRTINITSKNNQIFDFNIPSESETEADCSVPLAFLYEPNSAILKAGAFNSVARQLNVFKLHKHSHLYTSENLISFPGRCFNIERILPCNKKLLMDQNWQKANITTRNFPETVQHIRNSLKIKDGGSMYLYFTTNYNNEKIVIQCSKIS